MSRVQRCIACVVCWALLCQSSLVWACSPVPPSPPPKDPLFQAISRKDAGLLSRLLVDGANVNAKEYGKTALSYALDWRTVYLPAAAVLVEHGADTAGLAHMLAHVAEGITGTDIVALRAMLTRAQFNGDACNNSQLTYVLADRAPFIWARGRGHWDQANVVLAEWLLDACEKTFPLAVYENDAVLKAVRSPMSEGRPAEIGLLQRRGVVVSPSKFSDWGILEDACASRNEPLAKWLVQTGVTPSKGRAATESYGSLMHAAARGGLKYCVAHALSVGQNVNARNLKGQSPIHFAASIEAIKHLAEAGADISATDAQGNTLLHSLAERRVGTSCDSGDSRFRDESNRLALVQELVQRGIDKAKKNKAGHTAFDIANQPWHASSFSAAFR